MDNESADTLELSLDDVLDITDGDNDLIIIGDDEDSLDLDTTGWDETDSTSENGQTTTTYEDQDSDEIVTITLDDDLVD
ncbi:MAG: hypothetical protein Q9M43_01710 [Sulfurimonas sp.]|nr:hypothetical protein [Sulfurimonas sp.]